MAESSKMTISPLIATVLLIAFSFALGAVVLSWGETFVEARAGFVNDANEVSAGCSGVHFEILQINNQPYACQSANGITFILDNTGVDIVGLQAKMIATESIQVLDNVLPQSLGTGQTERVVIPYTGEPLLQIRLTPTIVDGEESPCPTHAKVINSDIPAC